MPTVLKSVSLNFLEPSGSLQACIGNAFPLLFLQENGKRGHEISLPYGLVAPYYLSRDTDVVTKDSMSKRGSLASEMQDQGYW